MLPIVRSWVNVAVQPSGFSLMQCQKSLTVSWRSFLECGNDHVICLFLNNAEQYIHIQRIWLSTPFIAKCVWLKIVDTVLTLTLIRLKQTFYSESFYTTNHIHIIDIQYCVCMYYRLYPGVSLQLNLWLTAIYPIWWKDEVAPLHHCIFAGQFTACRSFHNFLVHIARLGHISLSSSCYSCSITY